MRLARIIFLAFMLVLVHPVETQDIPPDVIPAAIDAAQNAIPELGNPTQWAWEFMPNVSTSNLNCPLVTGSQLPVPLTVYRVALTFGTQLYFVHVSADATQVQLCDSKFPALSSQTPTPSAASCLADLTGSSVFIYSAPASVEPVGTLANTSTYRVVSSALDGTWYSLNAPGGTFWVPATSVQLTGSDCSVLPDTPADPNLTCFLSPAGSFSNVRSAPSIDANQIDTIFENNSFTVRGRNQDASWYRIEQGWVAASVVLLTGDCDEIPFVSPDQQVLPTSTPSASDTVSLYICVDGSDLYLPTRIQPGVRTARVQTGNVPNRLRREPSTSGEYILDIQGGEVFDRVIDGPACNQGYVWWQVEVDGIVGWTAESDGRNNVYYLEPMPGFSVAGPQLPEITGTLIIDGLDTAASDLIFAADDTAILMVDGNSDEVIVWSFEAGDFVTSRYQHNVPVSKLAASTWTFDDAIPEDAQTFFAAVDLTNTVYLWKVGSRTPELTIFDAATTATITDIALSADASLIATAGCAEDGTAAGCTLGEIRLWDANNGAEVINLQGHETTVTSVAFSPDGTQIASAAPDKIIIWDVESGEMVDELETTSDTPQIAFYPTEDSLLAITGCIDECDEDIVTVWIIENDEFIELTHANEVTSLAISPDGLLLATGDTEGVIRIWADIENPLELNSHTTAIASLAFSSDGFSLASSGENGTVIVYSLDR